jgi:hypothetical protein
MKRLRFFQASFFMIVCFITSGMAMTLVTGNITSDVTWTKTGSPYILTTHITINKGVTVTMEAGVVIKPMQGYRLIINGNFVSQGTTEEKVVITSFRDDTYGGDANGDKSATRPTVGDWGYLQIANSANELKNCLVRYGTSGISAYKSSPKIHDCTIEYTKYGLDLQEFSSTITCCSFLNCATAIYANQGNPIISNSSFMTCNNGVIINNQGTEISLASINQCNFSGIKNFFVGTTNNTSDHRVNATNSWFGLDNAAAIKSKMSENKAVIEYVPFSLSPFAKTILSSDISLDDHVDGIDLSMLPAVFGSAPGDTNYKAFCNLFDRAPDRIDGFDLAGINLNSGKQGISLSKCKFVKNERMDLALQPAMLLESSGEYSIPVKLIGGKGVQSIAFDVVLPEGCTLKGFDRGEILQSDSSNTIVVSTIKGNRYIIGITQVGGGIFSGDGIVGVVRFRASDNGVTGASALLENSALFSASGEIITLSPTPLQMSLQSIPTVFGMQKPCVTPLSGIMRIDYQVPRKQRVRLDMFDIQGKRVTVVVDDVRKPGCYSVVWKPSNGRGNPLPAGYYVLSFTANEYRKAYGVHLIR